MKFTDGLKVKGVIAMKQEEITELKQHKWSTFVSRIDFKEREPTSLNLSSCNKMLNFSWKGLWYKEEILWIVKPQIEPYITHMFSAGRGLQLGKTYLSLQICPRHH
jgi:hypothetical protein